MKAMLLKHACDLRLTEDPLQMAELPIPEPGDRELLLQVRACGVCHTELDEIEGRTPPPVYPVIPGHQVVGEVVGTGALAEGFRIGDRAGAAWIYSSCGACHYCRNGLENLCAEFRATGRDADGGYAEYMVIPAKNAFLIPESLVTEETAPLLCAGAIGYRSLRLSRLQDGQYLGLMGFGASAHLVLKLVLHQFPGARLYVFARSEKERKFALELGADWAGDISDRSPELLDAVIDTTPVWKPVVEAMKNLKPGGRLIINAIRKEDIDKEYLIKIDYKGDLWMEKEIKSVANVTSGDVREFLELASLIPIRPEIQLYSLREANKALLELKKGELRGAKVLMIS